jgi:glycosyltransferase involved in cell wall biosynthesis
MAAARPVVATATGGIPEVVDDGVTGFLVAPRDDRAMADAIVRLLKDGDLRQRMGLAGLKRARERFSAERMLRDTLRVYQRVAVKGHIEEEVGDTR